MAAPMLQLPPVEKFSLSDTSNLAQRWVFWKDSFAFYLVATGVTQDGQKKALLLHTAGVEVQKIFSTLAPVDNTYAQALKVLDDYFSPKKNVAYERHVFRQARQSDSETVDAFITRLRQLVITCEYADAAVDDMIRDQVVERCKSSKLRVRLLRETDLKLDKIVTMARASEAAEEQARNIDRDTGSSVPHVSHVRSAHRGRGGNFRNQSANDDRNQPRGKCWRCNGFGHWRSDCPVKDQQCEVCHKFGHAAQTCRSAGKSRNQEGRSQGKTRYHGGKSQSQNSRSQGSHGGARPKETAKNFDKKKRNPKVNCVNDIECNDSKRYDSDSDTDYVFQMYSVENSDLPVRSFNINGQLVKCLIDSGATCNVVNESIVKELNVKVDQCTRQLLPYESNDLIEVVGKFSADVSRGDKCVKAQFFVVKGKGIPLIGYKTATEVGALKVCEPEEDDSPNEIVNSLRDDFQDLKDKYAKCFKGVGKLSDFQLELHIDRDVQPVAQPVRRMPYSLRKGVEKKLDELLALDVIEPVQGPTSWVSAPIAVPKGGDFNDIRLCIDMRRANEAIMRTRHPIPTVDELLSDMNGAVKFSKLDLKWGFHQIELAEHCRDITTFVTHKGLFRYKRLLFGATSAPEEYQHILQQVLQHCEGTRVIADDIVVYGKSNREHRERLEKVLQTLSDRNLTLNESKCQFGLDRVVFMGHVLSKDGMGPTRDKIVAVEQAKRPENPAEVRSFLGLVGYCSRYIQDLATVEEPLRKLTRSRVPWKWGTNEEQSFQELKHRLVSSQTMAYFNADASETQVICDASPVGLGCILVQKQDDGHFKPVLYASRALTSVERRYSQTEKEALAIVWSCERLHLYLFGIPFTIVTDHKPLEVIYASPKHKPVSARIERWVLRLQAYDFKVQYRPGKYNAADALSRLLDVRKVKEDHHEKTEDYMCQITLASIPVAIRAKEIEVESSADPEMTSLRKAVRTGDWSHPDVIKYKHVRDELTCVGKLILRGHRIVIPTHYRQQIMQLAHEGHQGIVKCKQRLREKVWWPAIDKDMERHVKLCQACQIVNVQSTPEPLKPTELPEKPWQQISVDICGPFPGGEFILVAIDYYSRWFEMGILFSITSAKVIGLLERWFASHGIPEVIVSDNGVQFTSQEFRNFMSVNGVVHRKVTPLFATRKWQG